jgi:hypothetical protein
MLVSCRVFAGPAFKIGRQRSPNPLSSLEQEACQRCSGATAAIRADAARGALHAGARAPENDACLSRVGRGGGLIGDGGLDEEEQNACEPADDQSGPAQRDLRAS